jgi:hypothetical protein
MEGAAGVTVIVCKTALVTITVLLPLMPFKLAVILAEPAETAVAKPVAFTVAFDTLLVHTALDNTNDVPSENVPVAVNCCVKPAAKDGDAGVTAMDCKTALVTVTLTDPDMPLTTAVIVALPAATPVANPELLTVAFAVALLVQIAFVSAEEVPLE